MFNGNKLTLELSTIKEEKNFHQRYWGKKKIEKLCNTMVCMNFYLHVSREIIQIFQNTLSRIYEVSNKNYKLAILVAKNRY